MDDSESYVIYFMVWPLPEEAMGLLCKLPRECLIMHTLRHTIISLAPKLISSHKKHLLTRPQVVVNAIKKNGTLAV